MRLIDSRKFEFKDIQANEVVSELEFKKCDFTNCYFSDRIADPKEGSTIVDSSFLSCTMNKNCGIGNGILRNVVFENLKTKGIVFCTGTLFDNVKFLGKSGKLSISSQTVSRGKLGGDLLNDGEIQLFNQYTKEFYKKVELALDISEATFQEFELDSSIPADKIKINNTNQVRISIDRVDKDGLKKMNEISGAFKSMISRAESDVVLVASVLNKKRAETELKAFEFLKNEGLTV